MYSQVYSAELQLNKANDCVTDSAHLLDLSTYVFSTLYTTLPHNLIKDKLIDLIERTFQREGSLTLYVIAKCFFYLGKT